MYTKLSTKQIVLFTLKTNTKQIYRQTNWHVSNNVFRITATITDKGQVHL